MPNIQISVYITLEQFNKLDKENNKSKAVREALNLYYKEKHKDK